jgi:hypothetical protein
METKITTELATGWPYNQLTPKFKQGERNCWIETGEEFYLEQLNCMPPMGWVGYTFLICEEYSGGYHACLTKIENRYFVKYCTRSSYLAEVRELAKHLLG